MFEGRRILAVVPARSGSRGILDKNIQRLDGISLIGWAGRTLAEVACIDRRVLSTDSPAYAEEGKRFGLEVPFLRPAELSTDTATAVDTVRHALAETERAMAMRFDLILIVEPSSPLRLPSDIERAIERLVRSGADSVVSVSPLSSKSHPRKAFRVAPDGGLTFYEEAGRSVTARQSLEPLYWRNGVCYALTRACVLEQGTIFGRRCVADATPHPVVNIDEPVELSWAEFLLQRGGLQATSAR